ncbi:hypothetical protein ACA30_05930 [Virgibacillus soli]|nr:hypothetical protein ACA30_05930 [Virgibacillus soli]
MGDDNQWYTNKDLFILINDLQKEMQETRAAIKKYNNLYSKVGQVKEELDEIKAMQKGKKSSSEAIRNWGGWLFALITLLILISKTFLGG